MNDRDVVIVEAVRTAVGRRGGSLSGVHAVVLLSKVLTELMDRAGVAPSEVEDVISGCVDQVGEQGLNVARNAIGADITQPEFWAGSIRSCKPAIEQYRGLLDAAGS